MTLLTTHALLTAATERLRASSETPRLDAELLLAHALGWSRTRLLAERQHMPEQAQIEAFDSFVARRENLEPVAYIVGHKEFYGLDFAVDRRVLVPRPETELLVERALALAGRLAENEGRKLDRPLRIVDIGTGSGAIAVALALNLPDAEITAVDLSPDALAVAAINVARHNLAERVQLMQGDLLEPLDGQFDLIVSNPPYTIIDEIDEGVRRHEPHLALDGGVEGLEVYKRLLAQAPARLQTGGALLLEIGAWQGQALVALARATFPDAQVALYRDLAGHDRVVEVWTSGDNRTVMQ